MSLCLLTFLVILLRSFDILSLWVLLLALEETRMRLASSTTTKNYKTPVAKSPNIRRWDIAWRSTMPTPRNRNRLTRRPAAICRPITLCRHHFSSFFGTLTNVALSFSRSNRKGKNPGDQGIRRWAIPGAWLCRRHARLFRLSLIFKFQHFQKSRRPLTSNLNRLVDLRPLAKASQTS